MENKRNKKKKVSNKEKSESIREKWIFFVLIPILCSLATSTFADVILKEVFNWRVPKIYEVRNISTIENFDVMKYFPLGIKNSWRYQYSYEILDHSSIKANNESSIEHKGFEFKDTIIVKTEKVYEKDIYKLIIQKGDIYSLLSGLFDYSNKVEFDQGVKSINNQEFALLINSNKVYYSNSENVIGNVKTFFMNEDTVHIELKGFELLFELPFFDGQRFGGASNEMLHYSGDQMWNVKRKVGRWQEEYGYIEGDLFEINFLTNPSSERITFVPNIGITKWESVHHGALCNKTLSLLNFRLEDNEE